MNKVPRLVGVVGAGQMGLGITQLLAAKNVQVLLTDACRTAVDSAMPKLQASLERYIRKGKLDPGCSVESVLDKVRVEEGMSGLKDADYVIEAASEEEATKKKVFAECDRIAPPHAVLASNTSSIPITLIASATSRPGKVIGLHFMNPPIIMSLIEIIKGMATTDETFEASQALAKHLGKTAVVSNDRPGFIVNRILIPMINEAFFALMEGVSSAEDIDAAMRLGTNQPMGPFTLADFIGLDVCLAVARLLHKNLGEDKYRPCPLLVQYVQAGWLGRKSGRGVFKYK